MKRKLLSGVLFAIILCGVAAPFALTHAQLINIGGPAQVPSDPAASDVPGIIRIMCNIFRVIFAILVVLVVIMVLFSAMQYLFSGGDSEKTGKANQRLIYAAVAMVVALLALGVPRLVASIIGGGYTGGNPCSGGGFLF